MELSMSGILNAQQEVADSAEYTNIRMYRVNYMTAETEQDELMSEIWDSWSDPTDVGRLNSFSAVCFLYARRISQKLGRKKPFGLIESNWGGTRIEPWSPPETLATCQIPPNVDTANPYNSNSNLYNAMIHPLIKKSIKGALWYQGESNEGWNQDQYDCTFSEMIKDWRNRWAANSPSSPDFPFGFAQLASWRENFYGYGCSNIRWHQTADFGYAPNPLMDNVFMAVTLDTHDSEGGIHPRNKQVVGDRLAVSGLSVAYGTPGYPANGPFFTNINLVNTGSEFYADITYDQEFNYNPVEISGFYICSGNTAACDNEGGAWQLLDPSAVTQSSRNTLRVTLSLNPLTVRLAYLWNESPVMGTEALPIYADDQHGLPSAPWIYRTDA